VSNRHKILVLEDDRDLATELKEYLESSGFDTEICPTVKSFWRYVARHEIDLIVVDLRLPDGNGLEVIREVRSKSSVPMVITSGMHELEERVAGIEIGADDYLTKPYSSRELLAKIGRILSRTQGEKFSSRISRLNSAGVFEFEGFFLDAESMNLAAPDGTNIPLTPYEFLLLRTLVEKSGTVLTREVLVGVLHSTTWHGSDRTIDNLMSRIRARLSPYTEKAVIKTVRGVGYVFTSKVVISHERVSGE